jgi:hypothetical protein
VLSPDRDVAPVQALRQLDLFYLDEPAPALDALGVQARAAGAHPVLRPALPRSPGQRRAGRAQRRPAARRAIRLLTAEGRIGPRYAVVNPAGRLRYRTFDPAPAEHAAEIQILIDALEHEP